MNTKGQKCRLVGDLITFQKHFDSIETGRKHPKICVVCGNNAYSLCQLCGKAMYFLPTKGGCAGRNCFVDYHDEMFYGLAYEDRKVVTK